MEDCQNAFYNEVVKVATATAAAVEVTVRCLRTGERIACKVSRLTTLGSETSHDTGHISAAQGRACADAQSKALKLNRPVEIDLLLTNPHPRRIRVSYNLLRCHACAEKCGVLVRQTIKELPLDAEHPAD